MIYSLGQKIYYLNETYNWNRAAASSTSDIKIKSGRITKIQVFNKGDEEEYLYSISTARFMTTQVFPTIEKAIIGLRSKFKYELSKLHNEVEILIKANRAIQSKFNNDKRAWKFTQLTRKIEDLKKQIKTQ